MTELQLVHISMVNSYNVLVLNVSMEQIIYSKVGIFSHSIDEIDAKKSIEFMIFYFKEIEMYEYCAELQKYIDDVFDDEGMYNTKVCVCEYPKIDNYTNRIKCKTCGVKIEI